MTATARRGPTGGGWLMLLILVVAAILRAETIGDHLSDAEGYSYLVGAAPSAGAFLHRLAAYENSPPLFYLLLTPLPLTHGTAWLRLPAAIPGVLIPLILFAGLRRPLGRPGALLAAGLTAVAPYAVSYSDYSRGFMLSVLGCLIALWGALRLLEGESARWWLVYVAGGALALYSEYDSGIFLVALTLSLSLLSWRGWSTSGDSGRRGWRATARVALLGLLPFLSLAPWIPQIIRGENALGHTKTSPVFPGPSPTSLRDVVVRLTVGEHGAGSGQAARWLEFAVIVALVLAALLALRRVVARSGQTLRGRAIILIALTGALVLLGHALAPAAGFDLFNERYLTVLIPLTAALGAGAVAGLDRRWLWAASGVVTLLVGAAVFAQRLGRHYQPDPSAARAAVAALHPREILTNSAVVVYYLQPLHPILDRPFDLGPGLTSRCRAPCVVADDARVQGGVRAAPGAKRTIGPVKIILLRRHPG